MGDFYDKRSSSRECLIKKSFTAVTKVWGVDGNNGVRKDYVAINDQDEATITINGATRTGGALESNDYYDQGSFAFVARTNATSGVATAFWTFDYADAGAINHEIDIEAYGSNNIIYSSYTSEKDSTHVNALLDYDISKNELHTYRFDWYRGEKVEYYIDNVLKAVITEDVPTRPMKVWIGAWCPSWAGEQINETFEMKVLSFSYKKF